MTDHIEKVRERAETHVRAKRVRIDGHEYRLNRDYRAGWVDGQVELASRLTREKIQDELAGHWYDSNTEMCDCGWDQRTARDNSYDGHLADAILRLIGGDNE